MFLDGNQTHTVFQGSLEPSSIQSPLPTAALHTWLVGVQPQKGTGISWEETLSRSTAEVNSKAVLLGFKAMQKLKSKNNVFVQKSAPERPRLCSPQRGLAGSTAGAIWGNCTSYVSPNT